MITNKLVHTITVSRRSSSSINDFGEKEYGYANAYTDISARVETYQPNIKYTGAGQRPKTEIIIYFDKNKTINPQDIIYADDVPGYSDGAKIGRVKEVVEAIKGINNEVHHIEAKIEVK